jgi:hypothetical protein
MRRRLFTLMSVLSLVLCVVTSALWVRSYWQFDAVGTHVGNRTASLVSYRGRIGLNVIRFNNGGYRHEPELARMSLSFNETAKVIVGTYIEYEDRLGEVADAGPELGRWGFSFNGSDEFYLGLQTLKSGEHVKPDYYWWRLGMPVWPMPAIAMILPTCWLFAQRKRAGRAATLCAHCGYDLRATPDRCPECGTVPTAPKR